MQKFSMWAPVSRPMCGVEMCIHPRKIVARCNQTTHIMPNKANFVYMCVYVNVVSYCFSCFLPPSLSLPLSGIVAQQSFKLKDCHENDNHTGRARKLFTGNSPYFTFHEHITTAAALQTFVLFRPRCVQCTCSIVAIILLLNFSWEIDNAEKMECSFWFLILFVFVCRSYSCCRDGGLMLFPSIITFFIIPVPLMKMRLIIVKSGTLAFSPSSIILSRFELELSVTKWFNWNEWIVETKFLMQSRRTRGWREKQINSHQFYQSNDFNRLVDFNQSLILLLILHVNFLSIRSGGEQKFGDKKGKQNHEQNAFFVAVYLLLL